MLETITFPVAHCPACARDNVAARDLDDRDEWVLVCARCSEPLGSLEDVPVRQLGAVALKGLGWTVEREIPSAGCGDDDGGGGGCSSCASSATCAA